MYNAVLKELRVLLLGWDQGINDEKCTVSSLFNNFTGRKKQAKNLFYTYKGRIHIMEGSKNKWITELLTVNKIHHLDRLGSICRIFIKQRPHI